MLRSSLTHSPGRSVACWLMAKWLMAEGAEAFRRCRPCLDREHATVMATARSHFGHRPLPLVSNLARSLGSLCPSPSAPSAPSRVCLCSGALLAAPQPRLAAVSSSASPSLAITDLKPSVFPRDPGCPTATATTPLPHPHTASLACSSCGPAASPPPSKQPASQPAQLFSETTPCPSLSLINNHT